MRPGKVQPLKYAILAAAVAGMMNGFTPPASAQSNVRVTPAPAPDSPERIARLARDVERAASLRAAKNLQYLYSQYAEFGMWDEMASLFSDHAEILSNGTIVAKGKAAVDEYLMNKLGGGRKGLPKGALHSELYMQPAVILSYDGGSATGRWSYMIFTGDQGGKAEIAGGMQINDYIRENGVWKFSRIHLYPQYAGPYETGYVALTPTLPQIPYPYSPSRAGRPVPDEPPGADPAVAKGQTLAQSEQRIDALVAEDKVRNLQYIYGYYVDRKMWSDVTDLFADDGVLEIAGSGIWTGARSIRRALERDGAEGLKYGQVNDHVQFNALISVDPSGVEARARGMELGMLTPKLGEAYWSVSIFENRYVKGADGKWRIREMRIFPKMKADYYQGWAKSSIVDPKPTGPYAPDRPSDPANAPLVSGAIPVFAFANPVTGRAVGYPAGARVVGDDRITPAPSTPALTEPTGSVAARVADAYRKLGVAKAYDAVENANNNFGYYLDDNMWDEMTENLAENGTRPQGPGFYVGRERVYRAMVQAHWEGPPSESNPRDRTTIHQRIQPVIDVAPDGRSAKIRTRLFLHSIGAEPGSFSSGMYPNDTALLENGVWKMDTAGEIDETYFSSRNWKEGWARPLPSGQRPAPPAPRPEGAPRVRPGSGITNTIEFPPDIPWTLHDDFRRKDFTSINWPDVKPMWFAYRNPVSGRTPPLYCPDVLKCFGLR